jgi:hypothetical protein
MGGMHQPYSHIRGIPRCLNSRFNAVSGNRVEKGGRRVVARRLLFLLALKGEAFS